MKTMLLFLIAALCINGCVKTDSKTEKVTGYKKILIYQNDFLTPETLNDWVMEGPGKAVCSNGKLTLIPNAQEAIYSNWENMGRRNMDVKKEYYAVIKTEIEKADPLMVDKSMNDKGEFVGGHIVYWNSKVITGEDFLIEYDFTPLSPIGLGIIFFSAAGVNGQDVLSDDLKPRHGVFESYTKGDINCYHISYWANWAPGPRRTCNMRKNPGFYCLANGIDYASNELEYVEGKFISKKFKITVEKIGNSIKFYINDKLSINFKDNQINNIINDDGKVVRSNVDTGNVYGGGRVALRQMADLKAEYSNFKVYNILKQN